VHGTVCEARQPQREPTEALLDAERGTTFEVRLPRAAAEEK